MACREICLAVSKGMCSNKRTIKRELVESMVLDCLENYLLNKQSFDVFCDAYALDEDLGGITIQDADEDTESDLISSINKNLNVHIRSLKPPKILPKYRKIRKRNEPYKKEVNLIQKSL